MKIRQATEKDIPQMLVNGRIFTESAFPEMPYDEASFLRECEAMISDGLCIVAVDETDTHLGGVGACKAAMFFNQSYAIAQERFWWVAPEHRAGGVGLRLLIAIEQAAKDAGCRQMVMISLVGPDGISKADAVYEKCGYTKKEHAFSKIL